MDHLKHLVKDKYEILVPFFNFILSFAWQGKIFVGFGNWDMFPTAVRNENVIPASWELILVYLLSRIFCFLIIMGLWKIVFFVAHRNVSRSDMIILGSIFMLGLIIGIILYPTCFGLEIDNYTNYLMVRRFQPTYWQSIYTGSLYGGCLMVIPHPIALFLVQWTIFWSVVSYIYLGIEKLFDNVICKYITLLLFLFPESYYLTFNAYRNNYYTVLVLLYISCLFFEIKSDGDEPGMKDIVIFSLYSAFLMVWRSEGVLIGVGGLAVYLLFVLGVKKKSIKRISLLLTVVCVSFVVMNQIQSIGSKKYYGQDYMIINTTTVLYSIFNDPNAYLSYEGAEEDLQSIESVIPVEVLKEQGMRGYRNYNWTNGRLDFNQTLATDERASAYMGAYYRIVLNNINTYLNVQINSFYSALGLTANKTTYSYQGDPTVALEGFVYDKWQMGQNEVRETWNTVSWEENRMRITLSSVVNNIINIWRDMISNSGLNVLIHVVALLTIVLLLVREVFFVVDNKKQWAKALPFIVPFIIILGELAVIILFMPEGRAPYLYPILYASYLMLFIYFVENYAKAKRG